MYGSGHSHPVHLVRLRHERWQWVCYAAHDRCDSHVTLGRWQVIQKAQHVHSRRRQPYLLVRFSESSGLKTYVGVISMTSRKGHLTWLS